MLATSILVSRESLESEDSYDLIYSNIESVNALLGRLVEYEEICPDALMSYFVDYYLAQMNNGGFSQFVYNSDWDEATIEHVRRGLAAMQAHQHAALFEQSARIIADMSDEQFEQFLEGEYFGDNAARDALNAFDDRFYELNDSEDLEALNHQWLQRHPLLQAVPEEELEGFYDRIAAQIPDLEERERRAREEMPRYLKVIEVLCEAAGQTLDRVTAGDPSHVHEGQPMLAWHFLTEEDDGHYYMVDLGHRAIMFHGETNAQVVEADVSHLPSDD